MIDKQIKNLGIIKQKFSFGVGSTVTWWLRAQTAEPGCPSLKLYYLYEWQS